MLVPFPYSKRSYLELLGSALRLRVLKKSWLLRFLALVICSRVLLKTAFWKRLTLALRNSKVCKAENARCVPAARPPEFPLLGQILGHLADVRPWKSTAIVIDLFDKRMQWYDETKGQPKSILVKLLFDPTVFTYDLNLVRSICGKEDRLFRNSDSVRRAWRPLFPNSMAVRTGDKWKRVRRIFVSAMCKLDFESLPPSANEVLERGFGSYINHDIQEVRLWDLLSKVTFDSFHKFVYGINFNTVSGENLRALEDCIEIATCVANRLFITVPFIWKLPTKTNNRLWAAHSRLCDFVEGVIEEATKKYLETVESFSSSSWRSKNFLDALVQATYEDTGVKKKRLTKKELRDELAGLMFAGFDTTTSSMSMILWSLAKKPKCQDVLYEEVKSVDLSTATGTQMGNLVYLNCVIKETLRLCAVAPAIARVANEDIVVNGYFIKAGTKIFADHEKLGLQSELWNHAEDLKEFKPERWISFTPERLSYFPFGFGGRSCPGQKVAMSQMQVILTYISQNFKVSLSPTPIKVVCSLGRTVSRDSTLIFTRRQH